MSYIARDIRTPYSNLIKKKSVHTITANDEKEDDNNHESQKRIKDQDKKQESKPQVHFEGTTKSLHGIRKL